MVSSDEESSDSSDDFLVAPDKINFDSPFFKTSTKKKHNQRKIVSSDSDESDDDFISQDEQHVDSADLLAEVMRNLEKANAPMCLATPENNENPVASSSQEEMARTLEKEIDDLLLKSESGLGSFNHHSGDEEEEEKKKENIDEKEPGTSGYTIPKEGVNIVLPGTELVFNRRRAKSRVDLEAQLIKKMNQRLRANQLYIHKVGLLCWLAHGFHLNRQINAPEVLSTAMSLVPISNCPDGRIDLKYLEQFTKWFKKIVKLEFNKEDVSITSNLLLDRLKKKTVHNFRELVLVYIATLRAIGLNCRLIVSLSAPAMKLRQDQLFQSGKKEELKKETKERKKKEIKRTSRKKNNEKSPEKTFFESRSQKDQSSKEEAKRKAVELLRAKFSRPDNKANKKSIKDIDKIVKKVAEKDENFADIKSPPRTRQLRSKTIELPKTPNNLPIKKESLKRKSEEIEKVIKTPSPKKIKEEESLPSTSTMSDSGNDSSSYEKSDSESEVTYKKKKIKFLEKVKKNNGRGSSIDRRVLSDEDEIPVEKFDTRDSKYIWVEVYVESEESWISVNVPDGKIHCVAEIYKKAPTPVLYIIGFNSVGTLKDITRRYAPHWLTLTRKQRVDEKWWLETLAPYKEQQNTLSILEDEMLLQRELEQPLPKTLSECKGHPLYAVPRHLLKFEALYPPDCVPLGHLKNGDAIYSRHCVHTLRSRETWVKQARVVKPNQEPYKIVKAMPKYDKMSGQRMKDLPLELFGKWQTTPYVPPEAKNGIVPRNEYGNVDLFQQSMLPKGTVHIDLPGLNRVARKLNIDCSPAVVGFNFGCRGALPAFEGFVVCEEFEDTLREAWEQEQIEANKRAKEKRDKRIWGNWRKLIRGLMIRERLAARYEFSGEKEDEATETPSTSSKRPKKNIKQTAKKIKKT